jgi:hypothetical protein
MSSNTHHAGPIHRAVDDTAPAVALAVIAFRAAALASTISSHLPRAGLPR